MPRLPEKMFLRCGISQTPAIQNNRKAKEENAMDIRERLQGLKQDFSVCKIEDVSQADFTREYVFLAKTADEISLVCETAYVPAGAIAAEHGWKALKICGVLDFSMVGVIARISGILAEAGVSIFVVSTYNTDYILIKAKDYERGLRALDNNQRL
jgi:hypothetical protein